MSRYLGFGFNPECRQHTSSTSHLTQSKKRPKLTRPLHHRPHISTTFPTAALTILFGLVCNQTAGISNAITTLITTSLPSCLHVLPLVPSPLSHRPQTSLNSFGSSVITPSTPFRILHSIHSSRFTVQTNTLLPASLAAFTNPPPPGPNRDSRRRLKLISSPPGDFKILFAAGMDQPM